jgi:hypothetical protein
VGLNTLQQLTSLPFLQTLEAHWLLAYHQAEVELQLWLTLGSLLTLLVVCQVLSQQV